MCLKNYSIRQISYQDAMSVIVREHYLHRKAPCSIAFGLFLLGEDGFLSDTLKGVICYGTPSSSSLRMGIAGIENAKNVIELSRLWVCDSVPKNGESFLIGQTLKKCGKEIVVSFADTEQGHLGIVYQATNWIYTGLSAKRTNWTIEGVDKHSQTLGDKYTSKEIREKFGDRFSLKPRSRKHRYIYINANKYRKQTIFSMIKYECKPYPKKVIE